MSQNSTKGKILVVEDETRVAEFIKAFFRKHDYDSDIAQDGIKAQELLEREKYCLILADVVFFRSDFIYAFIREHGYDSQITQDGIDLIHTVRRKDTTTPIIVITGYGPEIAQEAMEAGANDFLLKPFDILEMKRKLGKFVDLGRGKKRTCR